MVNAEYNDNVSILNGSWEIAVSMHAQYKFGQNSADFPERLARRLTASSCNAFAISSFLVIILFIYLSSMSILCTFRSVR